MIQCEDIFKRNYFESYSEFYLAVCMGAECLRRGEVLNMSNMRIEKDIAPEAQLNYFRYLVHEGGIYVEGTDVSKITYDASLLEKRMYLDVRCITDLYDIIVQDTKEGYLWSYNWASDNYKVWRSETLNRSKIGNLTMHIAAHMFIEFYLGCRAKKPLIFKFIENEAKTTSMYINLYSCALTLDWFNDDVVVDVDFQDFNVDLQYSIMCNNGRVSGRNKHWSVNDKKRFMEKEGLNEGSIAILWYRKGMCKNNLDGRIVSNTIIRIDKILDDALEVHSIPLNKTKEETISDYYDIPEEKRIYYMDMLEKKPAVSKKSLSLYSLGIENYFSVDEYMFITKLDKRERVSKLVTISGEEASVEMSVMDAIYWLLCQYEIDFDRELYKSMYSGGKDLMWDLYGEE